MKELVGQGKDDLFVYIVLLYSVRIQGWEAVNWLTQKIERKVEY
jgi:hypothetical protein